MSIPYPAETNNGVVTSWIPLTTAWASVSGCSNSLMLEGDRLVAFDPGYGISINPTATCQPSAVTTWWEQGRLGGGLGAGHTAVSILPLTCPEGFSTVVTSVKDYSSTLAMCCPPGYTLANATPGSVDGDCLSDVQSGATLTFASTPLTDSNTWTITSTTLGAPSTIGAIGVVGWNVNLAAAATTTSGSSTSSAITASLSQSSSTSSTSSAATASSSQFSSISITSSGLSTGAEAGLGVAVALAVIGLIALAAWIFRRRKANTAAKTNNAATTNTAAKMNTAVDWGGYVQKSELDSMQVPTQLHEMNALNGTGHIASVMNEMP